MNIEVNLDVPKIIKKVTNDSFGLFVSEEWKKLIDPYTPRETGTLMLSGKALPFGIHYISPYAEYVYYNRRGVVFITSGTGRNPYATDHWDIAAEQAGQKNKLYRALNSALKSGRI